MTPCFRINWSRGITRRYSRSSGSCENRGPVENGGGHVIMCFWSLEAVVTEPHWIASLRLTLRRQEYPDEDAVDCQGGALVVSSDRRRNLPSGLSDRPFSLVPKLRLEMQSPELCSAAPPVQSSPETSRSRPSGQRNPLLLDVASAWFHRSTRERRGTCGKAPDSPATFQQPGSPASERQATIEQGANHETRPLKIRSCGDCAPSDWHPLVLLVGVKRILTEIP